MKLNITFLRNTDGSPRGLVFISSTGAAKTVNKDNPNWEKIEAAVRNNDEDALMEAISMKRSVENFGKTGKIQVRNGAVYYGGEKLYGEDVNRILAYLQSGFPTSSMIKFLEAKVRNISLNTGAVSSLYSFLENKGMPITDNGTVLGYKGVREDLCSVHTGREPLISGTRRDDGSILNSIGETVWMDMRFVDCNPGNSCGPGLHIGSYNYAKNWGKRVMVVEFSPENVGMVPNHACEVLRVNKYRIVGEYFEGDYLGEVYNDAYARPDETPEPPEVIEVPEVLEVVVPKAKNIFNISEWSKGQATGFKDGKAHAKRKFYEVDKGRSFKKYSKEFVNGYLVGYRDGRN